MYSIVIDNYAKKQLAKIPPPHFNRIIRALNNLGDNPRPAGYKKLTARHGFRIRIGDYRVIYLIEEKNITVYIIEIGHRKNIYD